MTTSTLEQAKFMQEASTIVLFGHQINIYAIIIVLMLVFFLRAVFRADKDPHNDFNWVDLVMSVDQATGQRKASATKILQLVGGATGTFIVVKLTLQNSIPFDIFAAYLAYVASIEGFSKFMIAKYGVQSDPSYPNMGGRGGYPRSGGYYSGPGYSGGYRENSTYDQGVGDIDTAIAPKPRDID